MKTCSKCRVPQDETQFVKSPRYLDGLYPSCKSCRKKVREDLLLKNPLCIMCKVKPHTESHPYCYDCQRLAHGQAPIPSRRRDVKNKKCSRCKEKERLPYGTYCKECKCIKDNERWIKKGGFGAGQTPEQRSKNQSRKKLHWLIKKGVIKRLPCQKCGNPKSEAHHHKGYEGDNAIDVVWLCKPHHVEAEMKLNLTKLLECTTNQLSGAGENQPKVGITDGSNEP